VDGQLVWATHFDAYTFIDTYTITTFCTLSHRYNSPRNTSTRIQLYATTDNNIQKTFTILTTGASWTTGTAMTATATTVATTTASTKTAAATVTTRTRSRAGTVAPSSRRAHLGFYLFFFFLLCFPSLSFTLSCLLFAGVFLN